MRYLDKSVNIFWNRISFSSISWFMGELIPGVKPVYLSNKAASSDPSLSLNSSREQDETLACLMEGILL